ncbi:hypothetical protein [Polycladidibacter hongkongensis]|uniref:hypothetical protein n=1 Tax=Polycladidibacter hongkongensis TaxID=1647556 RepID=UPI000832561D|nr:hypothetical protein [Pseudovibrio hongkongensis]
MHIKKKRCCLKSLSLLNSLGAIALIAGASLFAISGGAAADEAEIYRGDGYTSYSFQYRRWRVALLDEDTGEDIRRTCTAWTGKKGEPRLSISMSNGDVGPPHVYPQLKVSGNKILRKAQQGASYTLKIDANMPFLAVGNKENPAVTLPSNTPQTSGILAQMQAGYNLKVYADGTLMRRFSLLGFTKAYNKVMQGCGFSTQLP